MGLERRIFLGYGLGQKDISQEMCSQSTSSQDMGSEGRFSLGSEGVHDKSPSLKTWLSGLVGSNNGRESSGSERRLFGLVALEDGRDESPGLETYSFGHVGSEDDRYKSPGSVTWPFRLVVLEKRVHELTSLQKSLYELMDFEERLHELMGTNKHFRELMSSEKRLCQHHERATCLAHASLTIAKLIKFNHKFL